MKNVNVLAAAGLLLFMSGMVCSQEQGSIDYGIPESFVEFHGIIAQEYFDAQSGGLNAGISSFDNRFAYLLANCSIRENIKGIIELKFDHGGEAFKIDRCYFDVQVHKPANFRAGKFYIPLLEEVRNYRPTGNRLVSPQFPAMMEPDLFRDFGLMVFGEQKLERIDLGYKVSYTNGALMGTMTNDVWGGAFSESRTDINPEKAVCVQAFFRYEEMLTCQLSSFACKPEWTFREISYQPTGFPGVFTEVVTIVPAGEMDLTLNSFISTFNMKSLEVKGTYIWGGLQPGEGEETDVVFTGIQASYRILENRGVNYLDVTARSQIFELDLEAILPGVISYPGKAAAHSVGVSVSPYKNLEIKVEYQWRDELEGVKKKDDMILFQAVIDF